MQARYWQESNMRAAGLPYLVLASRTSGSSNWYANLSGWSTPKGWVSIKARFRSPSRCPRPVFEYRDTELAVTEIALVTAVGETCGKLAQVAFTDWLAAQCAETFWTRAPAIHQDEFHNQPPTSDDTPPPRLQLGHSGATFSIVRRLMPLTQWFWVRILAFAAPDTSVARLILWLRRASQSAPNVMEKSPRARLSHARRLVQNSLICSNSAQAKFGDGHISAVRAGPGRRAAARFLLGEQTCSASSLL